MTHKEKVYALLKDGRWRGHMELYRLGCIAHSRIADLRRDGHRIECRKVKDGYEYRLGSLTDAPALSPSPQECGASVSERSEPQRTDDGEPDVLGVRPVLAPRTAEPLALFSLAVYGDAA